MNIAIVSAGISTHSGLRAPIELAKALKTLGNSVTFYAPERGKDNQTINDLRKRGIRISIITTPSPLRQIFILKKRLENGNHDIISAHCFFSQLLAARLSGTPIVWTYYGTQFNVLREHLFPAKNWGIDVGDTLLNLIIRLKSTLMAWMADEILPISKTAARELRTLYHKNPLATIPLGAAPSSFIKDAIHQPLPPTPYSLLLSVSRITPYKGFHLLINVVNKLSTNIQNVKLVIVGSAPLPRYLSYLQKIAGPNIEILINPSDAKLAALYQQAQIYATADEYLFYGLPIWEASSFGIPSVALNRKAASEAIIHGKTGFLAANEAELEKYLKLLLTNEPLRQRMGRYAQRLASERSWRKTARGYEQTFRKTLRKLYRPLIPSSLYRMLTGLFAGKNKYLTDLGSDEGITIKILAKLDFLIPFTKVVTIDRNIEHLQKLTNIHPNIRPRTMDITNMRKIPTNSFDVVLCSQVIEHIENQKKALSEIQRILKPGGKLFLSSVAKKWYGLYWHRNRKGEIVVHPDHVHEFKSLEEFINLIQSAGFVTTKSQEIPGNLPLFDYLLRLLNLLRGKASFAEHRDFYLTHPRLISWHKRLSFLPLPGFSIIEAVAKKSNRGKQ